MSALPAADSTDSAEPSRYVLTAEDAGKYCSDGKKPESEMAGGRHRGIKTKTLRRMLKKAGLKVSGKKATLTKRCKKAHLMRGGESSPLAPPSSAAAYPFSAGMVGGNYQAEASSAHSAGLVGGRRHGVKAKTLKKLLKRAGLKVSGKKATLRARAKKAHLVRG